jgi:hypothetical protein
MIFDANEIDNRIMPNMYWVHTEGGPHMFAARCSDGKEIEPIYKENIWPFIERISTITKTKGRTPIEKAILWPSITKKDPYPRFHLRGADGDSQSKIFCYFHQLLSFLLDGKIKGGCINHKNGKPADYRLTNLEWVTYTDNAKGVKRPKLDYDAMYDSFVKNEYL